MAFAKSQIAAGLSIPQSGKVFISVKDYDKEEIVDIGKGFTDLGFEILSTPGTARKLMSHGIKVTELMKLDEGRPNLMDFIKNNDVDLLINTPSGPKPGKDEKKIRSEAISRNLPVVSTISAAEATVNAIRILNKQHIEVRPLQDIYS
jgi:carbamoyl-phosphate synthase large subunit